VCLIVGPVLTKILMKSCLMTEKSSIKSRKNFIHSGAAEYKYIVQKQKSSSHPSSALKDRVMWMMLAVGELQESNIKRFR
jgi:hypothetical protein